MKRLILPALILLSLGFSNYVKAQTAVYICYSTGAIGYCYGNQNASTCAYNKCIDYGGRSPITVLNTSAKGYGAVAVGTDSYGRRIVGASAGYSNSASARQRAINECIANGGRNVSIYDSWLDD